MQQAIVGYHRDEEDHWVAELACGHFQHVRHQPPWVERPWVLTPAGRRSRLGVKLECVKCERGEPKDTPWVPSVAEPLSLGPEQQPEDQPDQREHQQHDDP